MHALPKNFSIQTRATSNREETEAQRLAREANEMSKRIAEMRGNIMAEKRERVKDKR